MVKRAKVFLSRALRNQRTDPKLLVITGKIGNGKTCVARGCHRCFGDWSCDVYSRGFWCNGPITVFEVWSELARIGAEQRDGRWRDCVEADFLVLDDVGSETNEMKSEVPTENLRVMLEERIGRWTVITMNIHPSDWEHKWDKRVEDRLHRRSEVVELPTAPSWWRKPREKPND